MSNKFDDIQRMNEGTKKFVEKVKKMRKPPTKKICLDEFGRKEHFWRVVGKIFQCKNCDKIEMEGSGGIEIQEKIDRLESRLDSALKDVKEWKVEIKKELNRLEKMGKFKEDYYTRINALEWVLSLLGKH